MVGLKKLGAFASAAAAVTLAAVLVIGPDDSGPRATYRGGYYPIIDGHTYSGTPPSSGPWAGYDYCLVLCGDDADDANLDWMDAADTYGVKYSINVHEDDMGKPSTKLDLTEMQAAVAAGFELTSTGRGRTIIAGPDSIHANYGVLKWDWTDTVTTPAFPDSLNWDISPTWITTEWSAGFNFRGTVYVNDIGLFNYDAARAQVDSGYIGSRCGRITHHRGLSSGAPGSGRWDLARYLKWDEPSSAYGFLSFHGSDSVFEPDAATASADTIADRLDRLFNQSAANGNYPIVIFVHGTSEADKTEIERMWAHCKSRGDVWLPTLEQAITKYRSGHVPVDPPDWAVYAKIKGITAADSIFWGLQETSSADFDSFLFHGGVSAAVYDTTDGVTSVRGWHTFAQLTPSASDSTVVKTGGGTALHFDIPYGGLPMTLGSTSDIAFLSFDISSISDKEIVRAELNWFSDYSGVSFSPSEVDYVAAAGVTIPAIITAMGNQHTTFQAADVCYAYADASESTTWESVGVKWTTFEEMTDFGDYIYPHNDTAADSRVSDDVTDYIKYVSENSITRPTFAFHGHLLSDRSSRVPAHNATDSDRVPYLKIVTAD